MSTSTFIRSLIAGGAFLALTATASAMTPLSKADTNNDGNITFAEFSAMSAQKFNAMDTDTNGLVTENERDAHRSAQQAIRIDEKFSKIDTDNDGFISKSEFATQKQAHHEKMRDKREARKEKQRDHHIGGKKHHKKMKKHKKHHGKNKGHHGSDFNGPDLNGDGAVDKAEHDAMAKRHFDRMDKNNDGILDANEQKKSKKFGKKRHGFGH